MHSFAAVVLAGGSSSRMNGMSKQLCKLCGVPVIVWSMRAFDLCSAVCETIVVAREDQRDEIARLCREYGLQKVTKVVCGGSDRQASVYNGVRAVSPSASHIAIHDGARPLVRLETIEQCMQSAVRCGAAIAAVSMKDTVKVSPDGRHIEATPARSTLFAAQTPQCFEKALYLAACEQAKAADFLATDDSSLVERFGGEVALAPGDYENIKITTGEDLIAAEAILRRRADSDQEPCGEGERRKMRIGHGYDVHRLVPERKLILGGVEIPYEKGLLGHSDADVLLHAVADSLLGAAALGDIGVHFPDSDPHYEGASSLVLLRHTAQLVLQAGFSIVNIDATIAAQKPKLQTFLPQMRAQIAACLELPVSCVSVKATTEEGLGFTGDGSGISATAVSLIENIL